MSVVWGCVTVWGRTYLKLPPPPKLLASSFNQFSLTPLILFLIHWFLLVFVSGETQSTNYTTRFLPKLNACTKTILKVIYLTIILWDRSGKSNIKGIPPPLPLRQLTATGTSVPGRFLGCPITSCTVHFSDGSSSYRSRFYRDPSLFRLFNDLLCKWPIGKMALGPL